MFFKAIEQAANMVDNLQSFDVQEIDKSLLFYFLKGKGLDYSQSPLLTGYFKHFIPSSEKENQFVRLKEFGIKELENELEILIPGNDRKLNGAFFTPTYIVDFIIKEIAPGENDTTIDLSCGCGAFLIGLLDYYKKTTQKPVKSVVQENIFGVDILPYNVERAKMLLAIYALQEGEILEENDFNIWQADSLRTDWKQKFDNVIGNPPYVKFQDLSEENRKYLSNGWRTVKNGTFNLYFAFFELGYKLLKDGGKLGYITPNNYFTSLAGEPLREFFQHEKCVFRIVDFDHRKVFDVQTYTAITFLEKRKMTVIYYDRIKDGQHPESFIKSVNGSLNSLADLNPKKWRLLKSDEQENIKKIETVGTPIGDIFDICVGIATLKDELYFVDTRKQNQGFFVKEVDGKQYLIEEAVTKAVFKISDFKNQAELIGNTRRIIFPYKVIGKKATPIPEQVFSTKYPNCYEYLLAVQEILTQRDKGKTIFSPFYIWGRTQGLTKHGKKLLVPTFSQNPRFLLVNDEESFFTNGYGLFFKDNRLFQHSLTSVDKIDVVQKILNSIVMHYYVSKTSVAIEGGYPCYQKNFIAKFSLPEFDNNDITFLRNCKEKDQIDAFLCQKYDLSIL